MRTSAATLSVLVIIGAAVVFVALEQRYPYDGRQRLLRDGFWMDLFGYTLIQNLILGQLITFIIKTLDERVAGRLHLVGEWPLPLQVLFFLLLHDFYIYWFHRWQHRSPILWRIHEAHHSAADVDWLSGTRSHFLEILVNQTVEFAPLVLLGAPPEIWYFKATIDAVWGMYIHSNIDVRSGWVQYVVNGPEMHRWHHAVEIIDVNFATKFAFWDWIFGTAHLPMRKPGKYGLVAEEYPSGFIAQTLHAFQWTRARPLFAPPSQDTP
jgi:sterol desaturase/sphingolipid hydroxylase (fatty acid hydroxylase superfamily)